ncbi:MAG: hypothetical protein ACYCZY_01685 [Lacisediminihabitans sp.]
MTILTTASPPAVLQDEAERRNELVADISASTTSASPDASALQSRPAILRRLASLLAHVLPSGVDRLVARASVDAPLATAVALHSGLSFALLDDDGRVVLGDLYPSERVVLVETLPVPGGQELDDQIGNAGAMLLGIATAVIPDALDCAGVGSFALAIYRPAQSEEGGHE